MTLRERSKTLNNKTKFSLATSALNSTFLAWYLYKGRKLRTLGTALGIMGSLVFAYDHSKVEEEEEEPIRFTSKEDLLAFLNKLEDQAPEEFAQAETA